MTRLDAGYVCNDNECKQPELDMKIKHLAGLCAVWGVVQVTTAVAITVEERCEIIAEVSASIMQARQNGTAKEPVLAKVQVEGEPEMTELFEVIVQEAYDSAIENSSRRRKVLVKEFASYWQTVCLQELSAP